MPQLSHQLAGYTTKKKEDMSLNEKIKSESFWSCHLGLYHQEKEQLYTLSEAYEIRRIFHLKIQQISNKLGNHVQFGVLYLLLKEHGLQLVYSEALW